MEGIAAKISTLPFQRSVGSTWMVKGQRIFPESRSNQQQKKIVCCDFSCCDDATILESKNQEQRYTKKKEGGGIIAPRGQLNTLQFLLSLFSSCIRRRGCDEARRTKKRRQFWILISIDIHRYGCTHLLKVQYFLMYVIE